MEKKRLHTKNPRLQNLNPMFHFKTPTEDDKVITKSLLMQARKSGVLNLSNKGLAFGMLINLQRNNRHVVNRLVCTKRKLISASETLFVVLD